MAAARGQTLGRSSFSRTTSNPAASSSGAAGVKLGPNGAAFVSSGIPDLDSKQLLAHKISFPVRKIHLFSFLCSPIFFLFWHRLCSAFFSCVSARFDRKNSAN
jgi:hypothetical protein